MQASIPRIHRYGILLLSLAACESAADSAPPPAAVGGQPAEGHAPPPPPVLPPGCRQDAVPVDQPCITDDVGVFVSASKGAQAGDGTSAHPIRSLAEGIRLAKSKNRRLYVCAETYAEAITLEDGISVFGDLDCSSTPWTVADDRHARIESARGPAVRAASIHQPTRFEGFEVVAADGSADAVNSVAVVAVDAPALRWFHVTVHAGKGFAGRDGDPGMVLRNRPEMNGTAGVAEESCCLHYGGEDQLYCDSFDEACVDRHEGALVGTLRMVGPRGGAGGCLDPAGNVKLDAPAAGDGGSGSRYVTIGATPFWLAAPRKNAPSYENDSLPGSPSYPASVLSARGGAIGSDGEPGVDGAPGAAATSGGSFGQVTADGSYVPADGTRGGDGALGQAGGGGGAQYKPGPPASAVPHGTQLYTGAGSGGGAGGCPGLAGSPGKGGGASIALVAIESPMTLEASALVASDGGAGGKGAVGSMPTAGGEAGARGGSAPVGGHGGWGGASGGSGSGGGGPSIAVAHRGDAPVLIGTSFAIGKPGAGVATIAAPDVHRLAIAESKAGIAVTMQSF
jgi:hypothetical protein